VVTSTEPLNTGVFDANLPTVTDTVTGVPTVAFAGVAEEIVVVLQDG
jgi:hypothetical protein